MLHCLAVPPGETIPLIPLEEMVSRLERAAAASPADHTEITWIEARRAGSSSRGRKDSERRDRTVLVRVRERGRVGLHRTGAMETRDLEDAVRQALGHARGNPVSVPAPRPAAEPPEAVQNLYDEALARLTTAEAKDLVQGLAGPGADGGLARLSWAAGHVAVVAGASGSLTLRRAARATATALEVHRGRGPGAGRAAAAARSLAGLAAGEVAERAALRQAPEGPPADWAETADPPLLLAPEAAAPLVVLLNRLALSSLSFRDNSSFLSARLGQPVFAPAFSLRDDATDPRGLPFPFDLLGRPRRLVELVAAGVPLTSALDDGLAAARDVPPTAQAVSHDEALASHLFLPPEEGRTAEDLARQMGDGAVWIGALDPLECYDPAGLRFRAVARGVRRLAGGRLDRALPDLVWEDSLAGVFGRLLGTAGPAVVTAGEDLLLGAVSTPLLAVAAGGALRPAADVTPRF
jgi:predicted Zn-dependent protease